MVNSTCVYSACQKMVDRNRKRRIIGKNQHPNQSNSMSTSLSSSMPSLSSKLCNGNIDHKQGNYSCYDTISIVSENGFNTSDSRGRRQRSHNFELESPVSNFRNQRRSRSSSSHRYHRGESKSPVGVVRQRFHRRNSCAGDSCAYQDKPCAMKNARSNPLRSSSRSSSIANRPRNSKGRASNRKRSPSRKSESKTSRSKPRDRSRSTSRLSSVSSCSSGISKTKQKRSTINILNETKDSQRHEEKNIKRANSDGAQKTSYGRIDEKKEDIAKLEKRLEYIRQMARDLEIELQHRRDENAGDDEKACSANNTHCGDSGDDVDNMSLATLKLSNRSTDRGIANRKCDGNSPERDSYENKKTERTKLAESITLYDANHEDLASKVVTITKNTKEAKSSTDVGKQSEAKSPTAATAARKLSEQTTTKLQECYSRRASTGGVPVDNHSRFFQPKNPTSPFQEFKEEKKCNSSGKFPGDVESHLISAASSNLSKNSIVVQSTGESVSSLSECQDNKNLVLKTPCESQEIKDDKDSQNNGDLVLIENLPSQKNQASTYSSSSYPRKRERCLSCHENDARIVKAQSQTSLLVENNPTIVTTSDVDILPSSVIVCAAQPPPPPPPPPKSTLTLSSMFPPSSLDSTKPSSPTSQYSSLKLLPSSSQSNANDNDSEPTASTSSTSTSTSMNSTQVIQSGQMLPQRTLLVSLSGGSEEIMSKTSLVDSGVEGVTCSISSKNNGPARNSTTKKRLSVTFQHPLEEIMTLSETKSTSTTQENSSPGQKQDGHVQLKLHEQPPPPFPKKQSHFPPPHRDRGLQFHRSNSMDSNFIHSNDKSNCNKGREDFAFVRPPPPPPRQDIPKSDGTQCNAPIKTRDHNRLEDDASFDLNDIVASTQAKYDETMKKDDLSLKNAPGFRPPPPRRQSTVGSETSTKQRTKSGSALPPPPARCSRTYGIPTHRGGRI